jgi:cytidine deaminase
MTFEEMYNSALDILNQLSACGEQFRQGSTVCVISTRSGRIFYGSSRVEPVNGIPTEIHAEIVAYREMQGMGEFAIDTMILIDAMNRTALLPCNNCIGYLLSATPDNKAASVAMPDRMILLSELMPNPMGGAQAPKPAVSAAAMNAAKGSLLKDKVNDIMNIMDDEEDEDDDILEELEEMNKPKKKKLFGLFG